MPSLVAGTESIGLVACSDSAYYETIEFYSSVGFQEIRSYAKDEDKSRDPVFCSDSQREAWLMNFDDESDETVMLKIRLVPGDAELATNVAATERDWRRTTGLLSFRCRNLNVRGRKCLAISSDVLESDVVARRDEDQLQGISFIAAV